MSDWPRPNLDRLTLVQVYWLHERATVSLRVWRAILKRMDRAKWQSDCPVYVHTRDTCNALAALVAVLHRQLGSRQRGGLPEVRRYNPTPRGAAGIKDGEGIGDGRKGYTE